MKKIKMKQDSKILIILLTILVVSCVSILVLFYKYFYAGTSKTKYGNRLEGIENYKLDENLESEIKSIYDEEEVINKVTVNNQGKIIYITIDFKEPVEKEKAQSLAIKSLEKISEENQSYYEIQFLLTYSGEEENSNFPMFGSKNSNSLKVVWWK